MVTRVLVLLATASNKLLFQWKGPAMITERRGLVNYRMRFESGEEKTFHIVAAAQLQTGYPRP